MKRIIKMEYLISKVCYKVNKKDPIHIQEVEIEKSRIQIGRFSFPLSRKKHFSVEKVVTLIKRGHIFHTIVMKDGKQIEGEKAKVSIYPYEDKEYIRTIENSTEKDNLEELPEYRCEKQLVNQ